MSRLRISEGSLQTVKWIALVLMTIDHVNKFLFNGTNYQAFALGRLAMPLFLFVLAYNLARSDNMLSFRRVMTRLTIYGILATPACGAMMGLHTLNIMFALLALTAIIYCLHHRTTLWTVGGFLIFIGAGGFVEFAWLGLLLGLSLYWYCRQPSFLALACMLLALASLWLINENWWAFAAIPVVLLLCFVDLRVPRMKLIFYVYYPFHLTVLWLIRFPMSKAGYLFF